MGLCEEIFNEFIKRIETKEEVDNKTKVNLKKIISESSTLNKSQIEELILNNKNG